MYSAPDTARIFLTCHESDVLIDIDNPDLSDALTLNYMYNVHSMYHI